MPIQAHKPHLTRFCPEISLLGASENELFVGLRLQTCFQLRIVRFPRIDRND